MILDIVSHADDEQYEENLLMVKDAYQCLAAVSSVGGDKGRTAFINNRGVPSLCEVIVRQTFQYEDATDLLLSLLATQGMYSSVRQTNSALSNLSLNIQGHVEVPKSQKKILKIMSVSCNEPLYVKI